MNHTKGDDSPGRQAGRQTKYRSISKFSKLAVGRNIRLVGSFKTALPMQFFRIKPVARLIFKVRFFQKPYDFLPIPTIKYYRTQ